MKTPLINDLKLMEIIDNSDVEYAVHLLFRLKESDDKIEFVLYVLDEDLNKIDSLITEIKDKSEINSVVKLGLYKNKYNVLGISDIQESNIKDQWQVAKKKLKLKDAKRFKPLSNSKEDCLFYLQNVNKIKLRMLLSLTDGEIISSETETEAFIKYVPEFYAKYSNIVDDYYSLRMANGEAIENIKVKFHYKGHEFFAISTINYGGLWHDTYAPFENLFPQITDNEEHITGMLFSNHNDFQEEKVLNNMLDYIGSKQLAIN